MKAADSARNRSSGFCASKRRVRRPRKCVAGTGSRKRRFTSGKPSTGGGCIGGEAAKGSGGRERRLKKLLAEVMLDNAALKDLFGKNG